MRVYKGQHRKITVKTLKNSKRYISENNIIPIIEIKDKTQCRIAADIVNDYNIQAVFEIVLNRNWSAVAAAKRQKVLADCLTLEHDINELFIAIETGSENHYAEQRRFFLHAITANSAWKTGWHGEPRYTKRIIWSFPEQEIMKKPLQNAHTSININNRLLVYGCTRIEYREILKKADKNHLKDLICVEEEYKTYFPLPGDQPFEPVEPFEPNPKPEPEPIPPDPEQVEPAPVIPNPEPEKKSFWQKFIEWLRRLF